MTKERVIQVQNGWLMLRISIAVFLLGVGVVIGVAIHAAGADLQGASTGVIWWRVIVPITGGFLIIGFAVLLFVGFFTLQPNGGMVLNLFGAYVGSVRESG